MTYISEWKEYVLRARLWEVLSLRVLRAGY